MENTQVGPFKIIKKLGTNRRQKVYHARQTEQDRDVALKFIKLPPEIEWASALGKIEHEVEILKKLQHENMVQVYGAGVHEDQVFFAGELVKGESLSSVLSRRGRLAPDLAVEYGRQIALMLEYIHSKEILHAKLTPDKILVTPDHKVKVSDLRLNRSRRRRWDATRRRELDIAAYMAPEQFTEGATIKTDFYSLGVIMYEMLTGTLPYEPDTMGRMTQKKMNSPVPSVSAHVMNCPIWLDNLVKKLLDPVPRNRPHSAKAIVYSFDELKKVDKSRKAAVSQVSGNFNPLTAGTDKTEANRLLGKKTKTDPANDTPFFQRIPFLVGALIVIALILGMAMLPASPEKQMQQAMALMASELPSDWRSARNLFRKVMENKRVPESMKEEAEIHFFETRRRTLVMQAEKGRMLRFQDRETQKFGEAVTMQMEGDIAGARALFNELVSSIDPEGDSRHILAESLNRLEQLVDAPDKLPDDPAILDEMIAQARTAESDEEVLAARKLLSRILLEFSGREGFEDVSVFAQSSLRKLEEAQASQANSTDDSPQSDTESDDSKVDDSDNNGSDNNGSDNNGSDNNDADSDSARL